LIYTSATALIALKLEKEFNSTKHQHIINILDEEMLLHKLPIQVSNIGITPLTRQLKSKSLNKNNHYMQ
jgi:hypothetical protein